MYDDPVKYAQLYKDLAESDDLQDLYEQYRQVDKDVEKAKGRRTLLVIMATFFLNLYIIAVVMKPDNLQSWLVCLLLSAAAAAFHFWLSFGVYSWLFTKNREAHEKREHIKLRIKYAEERQYGRVMSTSLFD